VDTHSLRWGFFTRYYVRASADYSFFNRTVPHRPDQESRRRFRGCRNRGSSGFRSRRTSLEEDMRLTARTDAHGDFTLALPAGGYDILVVSQAFAARAETVASTLGKTKVVRWKLDFVL
jgi:hypothetical protein